MAITKDVCKAFRLDFSAAIRELEKKYDVKVDLGNIAYSDTEFRTKMTVISNSALEPLPSLTCEARHLPLEAKIGTKFRLPGKRSVYTIIGFNPRAPKFNLEVRTDTGTEYRTPSSTLARAILVN